MDLWMEGKQKATIIESLLLMNILNQSGLLIPCEI